MTKISDHISYNEATRSTIAIKYSIDNTPDAAQLDNMKLLAEEVFEKLRNKFNVPIKVESFFRSEELNVLVGGAKNSQHLANNGAAIDIDDDYGGLTNSDMFYYIANNLEFDQLIWEFGDMENPGWVHVSYHEGTNRNKVTIAYKSDKNTIYKHFKKSDLEQFKLFKDILYKNYYY